jgi:hypothetical protein
MAITKKAVIEALEARKVELDQWFGASSRLDLGHGIRLNEINHIIEEIIPKVPDALPGAEEAERGLEMLRASPKKEES